MSVKADIDTSEYDENVAKLLKELGAFAQDALKKAASAFAHFAARYTPPDIGQDKIKKERYYRPIFNLKELIDSGKAIPLDRIQYSKGKRWKVIDDRNHKILAYTSSQADAKKIAKIETRGLMKTMWGKNFDKADMPVPVALQRLLAKSPQLRPLPYNDVKMDVKDGIAEVEIENKATNIENVSKLAEAHGYRAAEKTLKTIQTKLDERRQL